MMVCSQMVSDWGIADRAVRWFQFNHRTQDVLSMASSLLLVITYIAMLDRWFDHVDASPLGRLLAERSSLVTLPPVVKRIKRTVDVLRGRQEMSVRSLVGVQSHRVACSFWIGTLSSSVRARKIRWSTALAR